MWYGQGWAGEWRDVTACSDAALLLLQWGSARSAGGEWRSTLHMLQAAALLSAQDLASGACQGLSGVLQVVRFRCCVAVVALVKNYPQDIARHIRR